MIARTQMAPLRHPTEIPVSAPPDRLLFAADMAGTLVFAAEGAMAAIVGHLDVFGIMVLSFATALAGGLVRDVLIGATPPQAIRDWRYATMAFIGGATVILVHQFIWKIPVAVIITLDAGGLALFAVAGTAKALDYGINAFISTLLGTIAAVGGGTVRDILLSRIPAVLVSDVYATAALAGAIAMVISRKLGLPRTLAAILGGTICFALRLVAVWQHWNLPKVPGV
jgi:uncharacterized membrane protein YeiH